MLKKVLRFSLAAVLIGSGIYVAKDRLVFGKYAYLRSTAGSEENEDESRDISGAFDFMNFRKANPVTGKVDTAAVFAAYRQANLHKQDKFGTGSNLVWQEMGPDNIGGRCRAILVDKDSNYVLYAGGVTGGVFKSVDAGSTWKKVGNNPVENENVVSITQGADGAIYYGTGENGILFSGSTKAMSNSAPGYYGGGVFKSTDHGMTFKLLSATSPASNSNWADVSCMASDPTDANLIYAGNDNTLMVSKDAGASWKAIGGGMPTGNIIQDIKLTKDGSTMFVSVAKGSAPGGTHYIYRSTDKGTSFTQVGKGSVPTASSSTIIAISPSQEKTIYASVANSDYSFGGVYRSDDNGDTWVAMAKGDNIFNPFNNQGFYDNAIAVDPTNPDRVFLGGLNLYSITKTGTSVQTTTLTDWSWNVATGGFINTHYIHADHHNIIFDRSTPYPNIYVATDGGVSKSNNVCNPSIAVPTFNNADFGFNTTQFYGIGVGADYPEDVIGGAQDNGTVTVKKEGVTLLNGEEIHGGDGGYCEVSKLNPSAYFAEYTSGTMFRSFNNGKSFDGYFDSHIPAAGSSYSFIAWFSLWESANDPTSIDTVIYSDPINAHKKGETVVVSSPNGVDFTTILDQNLPAGTSIKVIDPTQSKLFIVDRNEVWMTREALNKAITPTFFRIMNQPGFLPLMVRSSLDGNIAYVAGTENGGAALYRITGLSGKVYAYKNNAFDPKAIGIKTTRLFFNAAQVGTGVAIDDNDPNHVLFCTGTYDGTNAHIFGSTNAADTVGTPTFKNVSSNMPSMPIYDVLINSHNPKMYLAATELGVYSSLNSGTSWQEENNGMERVPVNMLRQQKFSSKPWNGPYIYAGTYGRGVFYSSTLATGIDPNNTTPADKLSVKIFPNPVTDFVNVSMVLPESSNVMIMIYDMTGKQVGKFDYSRQPAGEQAFRIETSNLKQGAYFVNIKAGDYEKTSKILVMTH